MIQNNFSSLVGKHRLKIKTIADNTGVSRNTLTALYYGKTNGIKFSTLNALCNYFQCTVNDLIDFVPEQDGGDN